MKIVLLNTIEEQLIWNCIATYQKQIDQSI